MKVYVASSWRNDFQPGVVARLRTEGHEVYDFRHPKPGDEGFSWGDIAAAWKDWTPGQYVEGLRHPIAQAGFKSDMDALRECDACVVVEPCGISAHLEFGWAVGAGRIGLVFVPSMREPELMLAMADALCLSMDDVVERLLAKEPPRARSSDVTESLVELLRSRDAHGQRKYGTTLDRKDLSVDQWLQHLLEELLDGAGYVQAARREMAGVADPRKFRQDVRAALFQLKQTLKDVRDSGGPAERDARLERSAKMLDEIMSKIDGGA